MLTLCDCFYSGKPSWRRLLSMIASGELVVNQAPAEVIRKLQSAKFKARQKPPGFYAAQAERARLYQENRRRRAGIPPRSAVEDLAASQQEDGPEPVTKPGWQGHKGVGPEWPLVKVSIFAGSAFPVAAAMGDFHEFAAWSVE